MSEILVTYAGYEYVIKRDGNHYTATCQRSGRIKTRLNPNLWHNRHNGLVTDEDMIEVFEAGVKELQRQHTRSPRAPMAQFPHGNAPTVRKVHHKTPRGWKGADKS